MKILLILVLEEKGKKGDIFSIWFDGENKSEYKKFLENTQFQQTKSHNWIISHLEDMKDRWGYLETMFRYESDYCNSVVALPRNRGAELRMYCCRWGESILIVGSSHFKKVKRYQDDTKLQLTIKILELLDKELMRRIKDDEVTVGVFHQLKFELEV